VKYYSFHIVIEKDEKGKGYSARCPALPGCFSNGRSRAAARRSMREAVKLQVATLLEHGEPVPQPKNAVIVERLILLLPG
jgi:antitoxin HicB